MNLSTFVKLFGNVKKTRPVLSFAKTLFSWREPKIKTEKQL